jgi:hypothetical protein
MQSVERKAGLFFLQDFCASSAVSAREGTLDGAIRVQYEASKGY